MAATRRSQRPWKLAHNKYSLGSREHRAGLVKGRRLFNRILQEELKGKNASISDSARSKWVVSEDFGRLRNLWQMLQHPKKKIAYPPVIAQEILAMQDGRGSVLFRNQKQLVNVMMHPKDAYAFPVLDKRKRHIATVIHVGANASERKVKRLVRHLIKEPTGKNAPL